MNEGQQLAEALCKAFHYIANRKNDEDIKILYEVCLNIIKKKISTLAPELLFEYEAEDITSEFILYMIRVPNVLPNILKTCKEKSYGTVAYLKRSINHFILHWLHEEKKKKEKEKYGVAVINIRKGGKTYVEGDTVVEAFHNEEELDVKDLYIRIKEIVLSMSKDKQLAFLNKYYRHKEEPKDMFLEHVSVSNRYQLRRRMDVVFTKKMNESGCTGDQLELVLKSDFLSELCQEITTLGLKDSRRGSND